jgi:hypothetical protein
MARPLVGHRELHLDRRILPTKLRQPRPDPIESRFRGMTFSRRPGAGEQRLDFAELVAQLRLCRHKKRGLAIQTIVAHPSMQIWTRSIAPAPLSTSNRGEVAKTQIASGIAVIGS